ncbi:tyrosinase cofactor [Streptomyces sp. NK15101]|uniref:apotyrosinase chaperone MelC1 n=1 Tax=Streptomyces sp. NK15101 TaxID=2873261 RepID=UPI001CEC84E0|nr:tyrosinase cofactor [Streptomyces sp. NK15101]
MSSITRRRALGVAAGAAGAVTVLAQAGPAAASAPRAAAPAADSDPASFDEVYRGRRIQGGPAHGGHHGGHHGGGYSVTIDGQELHVMRNADGTWISVINHYEPVATPRALARAAVRELQGAPLVPLTLG